MKQLKLVLLLFFLFICYTVLSAYSYCGYVGEDLSSNILRLHIVANSNSSDDQYVKLNIRDNIIDYLNANSSEFDSKASLIIFINNHSLEISNIISETLKDMDKDYSYSFEITSYNFPTKNYGNITLPSGNYDCLYIKLGESLGENWWCIMFPTVCIQGSTATMDFSSETILEKTLSSEAFSVVSSQETSYQIKFKILEVFNIFSNSL